MVSVGALKANQLEPVLELATTGYCLHRKWGCGRITTVDTVAGTLIIDFADKPGHSMDMGFAAGILQPISSDHIMARKLSDMDGLIQMAALKHLDLIRLTLQSFDNQATIAQIQNVLCPDVISSDWKKWWEVARKEMKQDGRYTIPIKKSEPIVLHEDQVSTQDRLLEQLEANKTLKGSIAIGAEFVKAWEDLTSPQEAAQKVVDDLNEKITLHRRTHPALVLDGTFQRDELLEMAGLEKTEEQVESKDIWDDCEEDFCIALLSLPAARQRIALVSLKEARPDTWKDLLLSRLPEFSARLCGETVKLIVEDGSLEAVKETLSRLINQHQASSELLLWLAKDRSDAFADILGPEVFRAMLSAIERDQFNEIKSNRLGDYILSDMELIPILLQSADLEVIRDVTRTLQLSTSFPDMEKRSLLGRIVKMYPAVQDLISGDSSKRDDSSLIVSWASLEARRIEYEDLVRKKIPANSKDIAVARSYGDLRENHEYKSAKEMQKILMTRKAELETEMTKARGTDFSDVTGAVVTPGTRVQVRSLDKDREERFDILGAWDTDVDIGIISYLTPLAQALMNKKVGDHVTFERSDKTKEYEILSIERAPVEELIKAPERPEELEPDAKASNDPDDEDETREPAAME